ncbi:MAG TPA: carbohydrate-binding domain-containing protein [Kiritimatiellia bacterium]|nr:carbohydrate-binding domain-containing protein [Kiritimatiellia bacterium]HPS08186.1 carbohydrate-binding domain-containing protein [Kiritimatiellia bacterium]
MGNETCAVAFCLLFFAGLLARDEDYVETSAFSKHVRISFNGASAAVDNQAGTGVTYSQAGATLVFSNTVKQVAFTLEGSSSSGSVKIYSDHAFKLTLNGVALASPDGPALNIQARKRCFVVLPPGTANVLKDGSAYTPQYGATNGVEDAKGVLFSEGQLIFSGTGALTVNGGCADKHGICSDDSVRILGGDIRVAMTQKKGDGVHVNDRFRIDGGKLSIALELKGDGIDADESGSVAINGGEISIALASAESKGIKCGTNTFSVAGGAVSVTSSASGCNALSGGGALTIGGGAVRVTLGGSDCNAIKGDLSVTVNGGALSIIASGAQSKGIKTDGDAVFNGGSLYFDLSGNAVLEAATNEAAFVYTDVSYCSGIKASNVVFHAGNFSALVRGVAGRGISADNAITVNGGTFVIDASGGTTAAFTNEANEVDAAATACMKAGGSITVNGGVFTFSVSGLAGKGFSSDAAILFRGGNIDLDLSGAIAFVNCGRCQRPLYCSGVKSDGSVAISNGTFAIRHTGMAGRGISSDGNMTLAGGIVGITVTGTNSPIYTSGVYTVNGAVSNYVDVGSASAVKADGNLAIIGGILNLLATGACGKGLNVDGALTVGTNALGAGPVIAARTTGKQVKLSGGTSTGGGPQDENAEYSNPKAIKVAGKIVINGGSITVATANSGGEGIESKDTITVNGGSIEGYCYDDCMNASTNITINGGTIYCTASNNDAIDSNGTINMNGGVVAAFGATAPEEGLDCDSNTFTVNGGTFVGCGGATSYPNAGTQYSLVYTGTLVSNAVLRITKSTTPIFAFKMPRTYSSQVKLLCGGPDFAASGTYTVYTGATMTGSPFHGLYTNNVSSASGGTSKGSDSTPASRYYAVP